MTAQEILDLIEHDASSFRVAATDALEAFAEILAELATRISADDLTTLVAIGSVIYRDANAQPDAAECRHGPLQTTR
jgi:hypothetical protein